LLFTMTITAPTSKAGTTAKRSIQNIKVYACECMHDDDFPILPFRNVARVIAIVREPYSKHVASPAVSIGSAGRR